MMNKLTEASDSVADGMEASDEVPAVRRDDAI